MPGGLSGLLAGRDWVLADGATGTTLFGLGLEVGDAPELWNLEAPDRIRSLHDGTIAAGVDLFLTNSFGANAARLALHDAEGRVHEVNRAAAGLARERVRAAGRPVLVAGCIGPTGEILEPVGAFPADEATALFEAQGRALLEGGADLLWVETMSSAEEFRAAARAMARLGVEWAGTMSFDTAGRTMMGLTARDFAGLVAALDHPPVAFGANCGVGASDLLRTIRSLMATGPTLPVIAKGNAGIPKFVDGHAHYDGTPDLMARYAVHARDLGARVIGGCCGTGPAHLQAMRQALDSAPRGPAPDPARIAADCGPYSSETDGCEASAAEAPLRPRRGR